MGAGGMSAVVEGALQSAEALFPHRLDAYERNLAVCLGLTPTSRH